MYNFCSRFDHRHPQRSTMGPTLLSPTLWLLLNISQLLESILYFHVGLNFTATLIQKNIHVCVCSQIFVFWNVHMSHVTSGLRSYHARRAVQIQGHIAVVSGVYLS